MPIVRSGYAKPKGTPAERGYGTAHRRARQRIAHHVNTGNATCARCGQPIRPGQPWDLDHTDDRTSYLGPSHRHCNRGARPENVRGGRQR